MSSREARAAAYVAVPMSATMLAAALFVSWDARPQPSADGDAYAQIKLLTDSLNLIEQNYVEEVDRWDVVFEAMDGMAKRDPYSSFFDPESAQRFQEQTHREYHGVGFSVHPSLPRLTIEFLFPDSPAHEAGLKPGDRIVAVDGTDIAELDHENATARIKGPLGTTVRLTVERRETGRREDFNLRRARIAQPTVFDDHFVDPEGQIAYVRINGFGEATHRELDRALTAAARRGMKSLILDLRFNQGGLVPPCRQVANRFLDDGTIVGIRHRDAAENRTYLADPDACDWPELPLVVLVNQDTASAAEIVAGALQDHKRALLVGTRTYGKGVVQSIYKVALEDQEQREVVVKLTTGEYLTPAGRIIEKSVRRRSPVRGGLPPDIRRTMDDDTRRQLLTRLRLLEIPADSRDFYLQSHELELPEVADGQLEAALAVLRGQVVPQDLEGD